MEIKDKIRQIMKDKNLQPGELAAKLNFSPSSISHILTGRNKPGFDFLEKLLNVFPDIDANWIMGNVKQGPQKEKTIFQSGENVKDETKMLNLIKPPAGKQVIKVIILYEDGTFKDFNAA
jgi:transcriptional regulator with XRE-family HTH domain